MAGGGGYPVPIVLTSAGCAKEHEDWGCPNWRRRPSDGAIQYTFHQIAAFNPSYWEQ